MNHLTELAPFLLRANLLVLAFAALAGALRLAARSGRLEAMRAHAWHSRLVMAFFVCLIAFAARTGPAIDHSLSLLKVYHRASFTDSKLRAWGVGPALSWGEAEKFSDSKTPLARDLPLVAVSVLSPWLVLSGLAGLLFALYRMIRDLRGLRRLNRESWVWRRIGRVELRASTEDFGGPCSFVWNRRAVVLVSESWLLDRTNLRIAIAHELQHHRQGDVRGNLFFRLLRALFFWNPGSGFWEKWARDLQELACDEALLLERSVSARVYGQCLLRAAETELRSPVRALTGAVRLAGWGGGSMKGRIKLMLSKEQNSKVKVSQWKRALAGVVFAIATLATAGLSFGAVADLRIDMKEAEKLAAIASADSEFPIDVNEEIVAQLNRYVGTPDGRAFVRDSLARLENYRATIEPHFLKRNMPMELLAVPVVESGYRNLPSAANPLRCAGIWQFIRSTARAYGLRVDEKVDERLDVTKSSASAARLLTSLEAQFDDWRLALMAYNAGDRRVQKGIEKLGTRDPWALARNGFEGDTAYLSKVMAMVLVMKNPQLVR